MLAIELYETGMAECDERGKSAILFAVILILGNVIAGAIAVNQSTQNVEKQIKNQLGSLATIDIDYEALMANSEGGTSMEEIQPLPEELIKQIGERSEVNCSMTICEKQ